MRRGGHVVLGYCAGISLSLETSPEGRGQLDTSLDGWGLHVLAFFQCYYLSIFVDDIFFGLQLKERGERPQILVV